LILCRFFEIWLSKDLFSGRNSQQGAGSLMCEFMNANGLQVLLYSNNISRFPLRTSNAFIPEPWKHADKLRCQHTENTSGSVQNVPKVS